jgi:hypothetical protein
MASESGHSDIKTTQRHLNITDEEMRKALTGVGKNLLLSRNFRLTP